MRSRISGEASTTAIADDQRSIAGPGRPADPQRPN
jgi:hypothetical protein